MICSCDICGSAFEPKAHNTKRCSPRCVLTYQARWQAKHRVPRVRKVPKQRVCVECGRVFSSFSPIAKRCSPECVKVYTARWALEHAESRQKTSTTSEHKPETRERRRKWRLEHKDQLNRRAVERRRTEPGFRIAGSLRSRLSVFVRGIKKCSTLGKTGCIGCTTEELRAHLERLFKPGMSWANYGQMGWHIDHKYPLSAFQFYNSDGSENLDEFKRAMHYTNLQPLWWQENISKGATIPVSIDKPGESEP